MATNAQDQLSNRQYYAAHLPLRSPEPWFKHAITTGKPAPPDASSLSSDDLAIFNAWWNSRENGTLASQFATVANSSDVQAMITAYEAYLVSPEYVAWSHDDLISRHMQWRLRHADVLDALEQGGTVPVSADPTGIGQNPPTYPISTPGSAGSPTSGLVVHTYNSGSGNEVIPDGATSLTVKVWGSGGGGARHASTPRGGGAGGFALKTIAIVSGDWGTNVPYVISNGGSGRATSSGSGSAGGNSTVGSVTIAAGTINITAHGGAGGTSSTGAGASVGTGGDTNTAGGSSPGILRGGSAPSGGLGGDEAPGNSPGGGGGGGIDGDGENGYSGAAGRVEFAWTF